MSGTPASTGTAATHRRVEQIMGMPISLALRGRHANDEHGEAAWHAALEVLHAADRTFSTYRNDSAISRLARHELSPEECPDEVRDVLPDTDVCLSAGGDLVCRTGMAGSPGWRIGAEHPHDPGRVVAVVPVRTGAVATSGLAHRGAHIVDARSGRTPADVASVTVVGPDLVWADIDATAAFALGADALDWLRGRRRQSGLVVWADGSTALFGAGS